jgi:hypothetical protein
MENSEKSQNKTKVLVNVYEPLIAIMKHKFDAACLKRDAYLDKALRIEARFLREEVTTPNSDKAKSYVAENLKQLRLKPLNLLLSTETVELVNEVCQEKNIPRDVFINRFFLLLVATDTILKVLFNHDGALDALNTDFSIYKFRFIKQPNILEAIEELVEWPPFLRLRITVFSASRSTDSLYRYTFKKNSLNNLPNEYAFLKTDNALGFNTFMTDDEISEQEALTETFSARIELDKLLAFAKKEKQTRPLKTKPAGETK